MIKLLLVSAVALFSISVHANSCFKLFAKQGARSQMQSKNPILNWTYENGIFPDLTKVKPQDLVEAQKEAMDEARASIAQVKQVKNPTFENTIGVLEYADIKMKRVDGLWGALHSGFKDAEYKKVEPILLAAEEKFGNELWMDQALFDKIEVVYKNRETLPQDQKRLVEDYMEGFANNGLSLRGQQKERFIVIKEELSKLTSQFSNNSIESMAAFKLLITNKEDLAGLSESLVEFLGKKAQKENQQGYLLTLEPAIYLEVMKNAENSELRKQLFIARGRVAYESGATDNSPVLMKIVELRNEMAQILGYKHYSEYALRNKMAKNIETVRGLLNQLVEVYRPHALREEQELRAFVKLKTGKDNLEAWDRTYWVEKLMKEKYSFDESVIKEYLEHSRVQDAAFKIATKLYGITFKVRHDLPKFNEDTQIYEVRNKKGELISYFLVDPYARSGSKSSGAWASRIYPTYKLEGKRAIPISTNSTNFTKPEAGKPLLLTVDEAVTLFHEFGHALHTILSQARYPSQSGTAVARDFVELPSQFYENYFYQKEVLEMFAYHYKTKEFIPAQYIESIKKIAQFRSATAALRQVGFSMIDLAWHDGSALKMGKNVYEIEQAILKPIEIVPSTTETVMSNSFSHIFSGGYSSGYYSYKWAEILDADAFSVFKKQGLFNPKTAKRFQKILESGGSIDPQVLYKEFAGRDPSPEAMYERDGIKKD